MVKFGMANTLVTYEDQYWIYIENLPVEKKVLTIGIGGFYSELFADLVSAYILETTQELFLDSAFNVIYQKTDWMQSLERNWLEIWWLEKFQTKVNELTESGFLQLTLDIWDPESTIDKNPRNKNVTINCSAGFPYLDMKLLWHRNELKFLVHLKPNQQLKYLNEGSTHTNACLEAIPNGVIQRLSILTPLIKEIEDKRLY